jgi:hypothetical protein
MLAKSGFFFSLTPVYPTVDLINNKIPPRRDSGPPHESPSNFLYLLVLSHSSIPQKSKLVIPTPKMPSRRNAVRIDQSIWESYREEIHTLYVADDKSLAEVESHMRDTYSFNAT